MEIGPSTTTAKRQRLAHVRQQLLGTFFKADARHLGIGGPGIQIQDVFHAPDELASYRGNTPLLLLPGFEDIFFSVRRTVSSEISSTMPTCTNRSATKCIVHFTWPLGVLQARAFSYASCFSASFCLTPGRRCSLRAESNLPSAYFLCVRYTLERPTPKAAIMSASCSPFIG